MLIGIDPGLNPAAVITQAHDGQLKVLAELAIANIVFRAFLADHLIPLLQQPRFWQREVQCVMDPAGRSRSMLSRDTALGVMHELGLACMVARTNDLDPRLQAVSRLLMGRRYDGAPELLVDPRCENLIRGFNGSYRYVRDSRLELKAQPEKKHPVSDLQDALQYATLGLASPRVAAAVQMTRARSSWATARTLGPVYPTRKVSSRGWT